MKTKRVLMSVAAVDANGEQHDGFSLDLDIDSAISSTEEASAKLSGYPFRGYLDMHDIRDFEVLSVYKIQVLLYRIFLKVKSGLDSSAKVIVELGNYDFRGKPHPLSDMNLELEMQEGEGLVFNDKWMDAKPKFGYRIRRKKTQYVVSGIGETWVFPRQLWEHHQVDDGQTDYAPADVTRDAFLVDPP